MQGITSFLESHFYPLNSHTIKGKLCHFDDKTPIANKKIRLIEGLNDVKAKVKTDAEGNFSISFKRKSWIFEKTASFKLQIKVSLRNGHHICDEINIEKDLTREVQDLGKVPARTFEFQRDIPIQEPPKNLLRLPQGRPDLDYVSDIVEAAFENNLKEMTHFFLDVEAIQKFFGSSNLKVSEESFKDMIINGIGQTNFLTNDSGDLIQIIDWGPFELKKTPLLANVFAVWRKENDTLRLKELTVKQQDQEAVTATAEDPNFLKNVYDAMCAVLVKTEAEEHLGKGHLINGMIALALFREVKKRHPIRKFLEPVLSKVLHINFYGSKLIFGKDGVLAISKLKPNGINQVLLKTLSSTDYTYFEPRKPIVEEDRFAKAGLLCWEEATKSVDQFFEENEPFIVEQWDQIYRLSETLVRHSPEYQPLLTEDLREKGYRWYDSREVEEPDMPGRVVRDGKLRAFRPITLVDSNPQKEDLEHLKQFCRFVLFMNFRHFVIHRSQEPWATNLQVASLAPEDSNFENFGNTKPVNAAKQMAVAKTLVEYEPTELILENKKGEIYIPYVENLKKIADELKLLGYDISQMPYGIEI